MFDVLFLGGDPGVSGAWAALDIEGDAVAYALVPTFKLPVTRTRKDKSTGKSVKKPGHRTEMNVVAFVQNMKTVTSQASKVYGAVEEVGNLPPRFGSVANGTLQKSYGVFLGVIHSLCSKVFLMPAKTWQKDMFANKKGKHDKQNSIKLACELWTELAEEFVKDDAGNLAEAFLIAECVRRKYVRRNQK